ncbi:MAG: hypothetical protein LBM75_08025 [Myxococcales bacterium]|jgi:hypothetical protein|nr:hypothetical protein [Myxococcales bacterium]
MNSRFNRETSFERHLFISLLSKALVEPIDPLSAGLMNFRFNRETSFERRLFISLFSKALVETIDPLSAGLMNSRFNRETSFERHLFISLLSKALVEPIDPHGPLPGDTDKTGVARNAPTPPPKKQDQTAQ